MKLSETLKYDAAGLIPAVVQDAENKQVLMVGYMNAEAVDRTLETRRVTYWSRSRQKFWVKGETSGHLQHVVEVRVDCDRDCLLIFARQDGVACHDGYRTCFYRAAVGDELAVVEPRPMDPAAIYTA
jgi:phosphoribosyl-AMP cyclohydrolase